VTDLRLYLGLVIEMWVDRFGRLWMDTGRTDREGEMIIQLLDGSESGSIAVVAAGVSLGLTRLQDRRIKR
jgi:hypothetical protein